MSREDDGENRLSRWSRLKRSKETPENAGKKTAVETPVASTASGPAASSGFGDRAIADVSETENEPVPELPPVESLGKDSDFTPFLGKGVPEALTRAALRKLWTSDPALANLDGLNDYDEDYTIIHKVVEVVEKLAGEQDGEGGERSEELEEPQETAAVANEGEEEEATEIENEDPDNLIIKKEESDGSQHASKLHERHSQETEET